MKKHRTNIYLDEEDKAALLRLRQRYKLDSDAAVVRFCIHKVDREESLPHVSGATGQHRQNRPT